MKTQVYFVMTKFHEQIVVIMCTYFAVVRAVPYFLHRRLSYSAVQIGDSCVPLSMKQKRHFPEGKIEELQKGEKTHPKKETESTSQVPYRKKMVAN